MRSIWQDVQFGLRMFARNPGFAVTAVLCLALGIGATTAVFSIADVLLLQPLPCKEPSRLVRFFERHTDGRNWPPSAFAVSVCREKGASFEGMAAYGNAPMKLSWPEGSEMLQGTRCTIDLMNVLGMNPALGRSFLPGEDGPDGPRVALLGFELWQRVFDGSPDVLGREITLNDSAYTVIGVLPRSIDFLIESYDIRDNVLSNSIEVMVPFNIDAVRSQRWMRVVTRLKDGVTMSAAGDELDGLIRRVAHERPVQNARVAGAALVPFNAHLTSTYRPMLITLQGAVFCVLLISCANVANMLFARGIGRQREVAMRIALGAARLRILRQFVIESLLLSAAGGVLGILLALWEIVVFRALGPGAILRLADVKVDLSVLLFVLAVSVLTAVLLGCLQMLRPFTRGIADALAPGVKASSMGRRQHWMLRMTLVSEISLTLVLVVGAGLMLNSVWRLSRVDPGFDPRGLMTVGVSLPDEVYPTAPERNDLIEKLQQEVKGVPGVHSVGVSSCLPMTFSERWRISVEDGDESNTVRASVERVSDNYLEAMGVPVLEGRDFSGHSPSENRGKAIVNMALAGVLFDDESALGKRLTVNDWVYPRVEIVGIVGNVRARGLAAPVQPAIYFPKRERPDQVVMLAVRTSAYSPGTPDDIRRAVWGINPGITVMTMRPMADIVADTVSEYRFVLFLLGSFAATALLLAMLGIYGLSSYSVDQRVREIGIRMALGAEQNDVVWLVLRQGVTLILVALVIGVAAAFALTRFISSVLYGIGPSDPLTFAGAVILMGATSLVACYVPARRATRIDPMTAIRYE